MKSKIGYIISILLLLIATLIMTSCQSISSSAEYKEDDANVMAFEKRIKEKYLDYVSIPLNELTPFSWEKVYFFEPYASREYIIKTVGFSWPGVRETVSENMMQVVFINKGKVVCYLYGSKDYYMESDNEILIGKDNPRFIVSEPGGQSGSTITLKRYNDRFATTANVKLTDEKVGEWHCKKETKLKNTIVYYTSRIVVTRDGIVVGNVNYSEFIYPDSKHEKTGGIDDPLGAGSAEFVGSIENDHANCNIIENDFSIAGNVEIKFAANRYIGNLRYLDSKDFEQLEGQYAYDRK